MSLRAPVCRVEAINVDTVAACVVLSGGVTARVKQTHCFVRMNIVDGRMIQLDVVVGGRSFRAL